MITGGSRWLGRRLFRYGAVVCGVAMAWTCLAAIVPAEALDPPTEFDVRSEATPMRAARDHRATERWNQELRRRGLGLESSRTDTARTRVHRERAWGDGLRLLQGVGGAIAHVQAGEDAASAARRAAGLLEGLEDRSAKSRGLDQRVGAVFEGVRSEVTHVWLQDYLAGLPVWGGRTGVHIDRKGGIRRIERSAFQTSAAAFGPVDPVLTEAEALDAVRAALLGYEISGYEGGRRSKSVQGELLWYPIDPWDVRLAWRLNLGVELGFGIPWLYRAVVDARTGEMLSFVRMTRSAEEPSWLVFTGESPQPGNLSPLPSEPDTDPVSNTRREVVVYNGDPVASPLGWIPDGGVTTVGNNVHAFNTLFGSDDSGRAFSTDRLFHFPLDLTRSWTPTGYREASTVNLFYLSNVAHDYFYVLGFDEAAGNYQADNFGRGGRGNDPVLAETLNQSEFDNAFFNPSIDGLPPSLVMMVWTRSLPHRDSSYDAQVVFHEYTHGVSIRLVGGPDEVNVLEGYQSGGMGEGWSDFFALSMTAQPDRDVHTPVPMAAYSTNNYVKGLRRHPYTDDMSTNPVTYNWVRNSTSVHEIGEVWGSALWDAWIELVECYGFEAGRERMERLVLEGMALTDPRPTFLDGRDAILLADEVIYDGVHQRVLWNAFARRGIGLGAWDGGHEDATFVTEAFDLPVVWAGKGELVWDAVAVRPEAEVRTVPIRLRDGDLGGSGTVTVWVESTATGDGEEITLTEMGCGSGVFTGEVPYVLGPAVPLDGNVQVAEVGTLSATYDDTDDQGVLNPVVVPLDIDLEPPAFEGVASVVPGVRGLEVVWTAVVDASPPVEYRVFVWPDGTERPIEPRVTVRDSNRVLLSELDPLLYRVLVRARDGAGNEDSNERALLARPLPHGDADGLRVSGLEGAFAPGTIGSFRVEVIDRYGNRVTGGEQPMVRVGLTGPGLLLDFDNPSVIERTGPQQCVVRPESGVSELEASGFAPGWVAVRTRILDPDPETVRGVEPDHFVRVPSVWMDLEENGGTDIGIFDDDHVIFDVPIGFAFPYDGSLFSSIDVSANGYASFGGTYYFGDHYRIPDSRKPNGYLAPFATDTLPRIGDSRVLVSTRGAAPRRVFIVQWTRMGLYDDPEASLTFQLLLYESGEVEFQYADMLDGAFHFSDGSDATIGVENLDGTAGVQFAFMEPETIAPWSGLRLEVRGGVPMLITEHLAPASDSDGDRLSDLVEPRIGTDADSADSDGDGLSDWEEVYLTGTDPSDRGSRFEVSVRPENGRFVLTWPSRLGRYYTIQTHSALPGATWEVLPDVDRREGIYPIDAHEWSPLDMEGRFFRVLVSD